MWELFRCFVVSLNTEVFLAPPLYSSSQSFLVLPSKFRCIVD